MKLINGTIHDAVEYAQRQARAYHTTHGIQVRNGDLWVKTGDSIYVDCVLIVEPDGNVYDQDANTWNAHA